jgi:hypothetical protein
MTEFIEIGKTLFEKIPRGKDTFWGVLILSLFKDDKLNELKEIRELRKIILSNEWDKAHKQFSKIREIRLNNLDKIKEPYLILCEKIAKITSNETNTNAPFDKDSGHSIYGLALKYAKSTLSLEQLDKVQSVLNIFQPNQDNYFSKLTRASGDALINNIFNNKAEEFETLKLELPITSNSNNITLENISNRIHLQSKKRPNCSFEYQLDVKFQKTKIGYYSLLWDNELNLIDEFLVIK